MRNYFIEKNYPSLNKNGIMFFDHPVIKFDCCLAHIQSSIEFIHFITGEYNIYSDGERFTAHSGDTVLFRAGTVHSITSNDIGTGHYLVLQITLEQLLALSDKDYGNHYVIALSNGASESKKFWKKEECEQKGITDCFNRMFSASCNYIWGNDLRLKASIAELLHIILTDLGQQNVISEAGKSLTIQIYDVMKYINEHYAENLTAEQCSKQSNMSYSYFSRNFKKISGMTFKDYLNLVRITNAERLLITTDLSVSEISQKVGYNSESYFIATYKAIKSITPLAFRKSLESK
ncbi:MAG: AraC family transcriptional regulator [Acutalibacteraceae bacterium]|nr:AraC family transcriptional regulator [Acutalibacteraceae bacterium]